VGVVGRWGCFVFLMKIISWNLRGFDKRREVCQLVKKKHPFILCIQETKLSGFDDAICKSSWGDATVDYFYQPSTGSTDGLVMLWD